jgi:hypothetical protein
MFMRRVILLAILALALPTAALATTVTVSYPTGLADFASANIPQDGTVFEAAVEGGGYLISIFSPKVDQVGRSFLFNGGEVFVYSESEFQLKLILQASIADGGVFLTSAGKLVGGGSLEPGGLAWCCATVGFRHVGSVKSGSFSFVIDGAPSIPALPASAVVDATILVQEPSAVEGLLLGTGLLGLAEMTRRKLKLGT